MSKRKISCRRLSCSLTVQRLWDAMKVISFQRQPQDIDHITKYMTRIYNMSPEEVEKQLNYCVHDGLLILTKKVGIDGSNFGEETKKYKLPGENVEKDSHDWYCFQCHSAGDVIECTSCFRVYHILCIEKKDLPVNNVKHKFICNICKNFTFATDASKEIKKSQLNRLLYHTIKKFKEKIPIPWTDRKIATAPPSTFSSDRLQLKSQLKRSYSQSNITLSLKDEDRWRIDLLIFKVTDLQMMENKADKGNYKNIEDFRADILTFVHNIIIFHGVHSSLADYCRFMLRDFNCNLDEIIRCYYCYKYSTQTNSKFWFCKPCKPPHELVYAKQDDFSYWPAKVLKIEGDTFDVRFFGGEHKLGIIDKSHIRPISMNIDMQPALGSISQWNNACEELHRYQLQLNKITSGLTVQISSSSDSSEAEDEEEKSQIEYLHGNKQKQKNNDEKMTVLIKTKTNNDSKFQNKKIPAPKKVLHKKKTLWTKNTKTKILNEKRPRGRPKISNISGAKANLNSRNEESELKVEENKCSIKEPVQEKLKKPLTIIKNIYPPKKEILFKKKPEKRQKGKSIKSFASVSSSYSPDKQLKMKFNNSKKNGNVSEVIKTPISTSPFTKIIPAIASKEVIQDPAIIDDTVSSGQDLVCSVGVQTSEIQEDPAKSYINKIRAEMEKKKHKAIEQLIQKHNKQINMLRIKQKTELSEMKLTQWCKQCLNEATYFCCWNTSYCSKDCQLIHWHSEHKMSCRRKKI